MSVSVERTTGASSLIRRSVLSCDIRVPCTHGGCHAHGESTRVVVTESLQLECDLASPGRARRFAARTVAGRRRADEVELLTSELVTNAVRHARTEAELVVHVHPKGVRVEVIDGAAEVPRLRAPDDEGGRGLRLVELVSDRWGVEPHPPGKVVWFEIDE